MDAYNLAYSTGRAVSFSEAYRMALELSEILLKSGYRVLFVFDGFADIPHPTYIKFSGETERGMSADEWIIRYVSSHTGDTIKLITRDRSLADRARHVHPNLYVMDPQDFLRFVDRLEASAKSFRGKEAVNTYDLQMDMMRELDDFITSLRRRKRRKRRR
ncbi:MAG: hypothetical protein GXO29_06080 [Thermotogae bacterium]|nr:hypothetical protein [Thermotogota bacterium]